MRFQGLLLDGRVLIAKVHAFIVRDFIIESSYKAAFAVEILRSLFPVLLFYFIAQLVVVQGGSVVASRGGGYFPFVLVGLALGQYLMHALLSFTASVRRAQMAGCFEAMLSTRTSPQLIVALAPVYSFVFKTVHVLVVLATGALVLNVDFSRCNYTSVLATLILSAVAFSGIGILSAALIVLLKKGDPIEWFLGTSLALISGVYFPIDLLPRPLQAMAYLSPLTHALEAMRLAIFQGATIAELCSQFAVLAGITAIMVPLGIWAFGYAVARGRRDGSLMLY
jgi:ABC-2 type transport system permease protein